MANGSTEIEPFLMAVLSSRINSIARQMTYTFQRSARSSVMASARDLSTAICDANGEVVALPDGFPVHVANMSLPTRPVIEFHGDDLREGDAYLLNSPYHGNTHPADHTIIVPVFWEGELLFFCCCRGHQADIGNSAPTTYHAYARDVYEEGPLIFPAVRVQREYRDIEDIIRMCKLRIRVADQWYGDYLAGIGAARIGERSLKELMAKYGKETIRAFCQQWQEYGRRRMIEEIRKLPAGTWYNESRFDPVPGALPDGVNVRVKMTIDPDEGRIIVDFTDNIDSQPCGLNLCEATVISAGRAGVLNHMGADMPLCEGSMSRIVVKIREGSMIGKAEHPFSSSVATNSVNDRAIFAVQCAFNQVKETMAMAEGSMYGPVGLGVISGHDSRYQRPYVTQLMSGYAGGMGIHGHDGYVNYASSCGGMLEWNPIEVLEQRYPVKYLHQELIPDSGGAGKWDGAPGCRAVIAARQDPVTFMYTCDGHDNPPKGALGGHDGSPNRAALLDLSQSDPKDVDLPRFHRLDLQPGEAIVSHHSSGGGCGDPLERDPELVRHRAREGWISLEKARDVYGVVLDTTPELYAVDYEATEERRAQLRLQKGTK